MNYSQIPYRASSRDMVDTFGGYNHNLRIGDNEFYDMENMTSDLYPILSPRKGRGYFATPASPQGLIAKDEVCYIDGSKFVKGETVVEMNLSTSAADNPKQLVSMGAYVVILPDRKYINTLDMTFGEIDAEFTANSATLEMCNLNGESYTDVTVSPDEPSEPQNLDYWIDTSSTPHVLKQYSASGWVSIPTTYVKITATGIGASFNQYDGVNITSVPIESSQVIWGKGDDYIIVTGILDEVTTVEDITVSRQMPKMDFVIESANRLWGCRYGLNNSGEIVNEIYASKLGDFKNWHCYMGISTDSYTASVGSDGPFTGAVTYLGSPMFFKEHCVHRVYGNYPANFQIQDTSCRGVQEGCHKSLAIVNETLYYKSRNAVCAFDGSPIEISSQLGNVFYEDAVAVAHGNKYYISMKSDEYNLFVYDTQKGMWHREDDLCVTDFCSFKGEIYAIADQNIITLLNGEEKVKWMVQTGNLGLSSPDMKYLSQILIRTKLAKDAKMTIYVQYDMSDEWLMVCNIFGTSLRSFNVPVRPRRTDHVQLKIVGEGDCKIYSITKTIEQGSERS